MKESKKLPGFPDHFIGIEEGGRNRFMWWMYSDESGLGTKHGCNFKGVGLIRQEAVKNKYPVYFWPKGTEMLDGKCLKPEDKLPRSCK